MTGGGQPRRERRAIPRAVRGTVRRALVAAAGGALLVLGAGAPGAQAAEGYRYWSFWDRDGDSWVYATKGPGIERPADGDVHGVRFAVSEESGGGPRPRGAADFGAVCGDTPPGDGRKRVALVLDFGTAAHAPDGRTPPPARTECASVPEDATLGDALAAVAEPLRYDSNGLLCAIDGYPRSGCAEPASADEGAGEAEGPRVEVTYSAVPGDEGAGEARDRVDISTVPADEAGDSGPSTGTVGGLVMVAVLAGLTVWQLRRRRT
ncbi:SCO2322 family protein [Streptomyces sp. NPDC004134]|uniref:SCO2322 family protein n=1 Tax=Streptomyces sp. NPDC004134 TaxID=3364691 RepID=UPI0036C603F4